MIQGVIFDMDGLLIDSEPLWKEAEIRVFATVGIDLTHRGCEATVGMRINEVVDYWYDQFPWAQKSKVDVVREIVVCMHELILKKAQTKKGVNAIIAFFKEQNIPMTIATSSHQQLLDTVIEKLGLKNVIHSAHSAEFENYGKPHPSVFLTAAKTLGIKPEQCLVFEDSFNGVIAAKAAQMKVVAVPEAAHLSDKRLCIADEVIKSLSDFDFQLWEKLGV